MLLPVTLLLQMTSISTSVRNWSCALWGFLWDEFWKLKCRTKSAPGLRLLRSHPMRFSIPQGYSALTLDQTHSAIWRGAGIRVLSASHHLLWNLTVKSFTGLSPSFLIYRVWTPGLGLWLPRSVTINIQPLCLGLCIAPSVNTWAWVGDNIQEVIMWKNLGSWVSLLLRNCCHSFWDPQTVNGVT